VSPSRVDEPLDVVEHLCPSGVAGTEILRARRSVFSDEKKLSIAALSHTLPDLLIEQVTPW
jgi:hypothetical protein